MKNQFNYAFVQYYVYPVSAGALKCYQCHSMDEYTCGEFFRTDETAVELTECRLSNAKYCIKTTGIYDGKTYHTG